MLDELETLPPSAWGDRLKTFASADLLRGAISVVRDLLPEWKESRPKDRRPEMAVEAAEEWLARRTTNLVAHARLLAKECSKARAASLGSEHRIAEAARAVAQVPAARSEEQARSLALEAIVRAEEHVLYRYAVDGVYGKEAEVRRAILARLRQVLASGA